MQKNLNGASVVSYGRTLPSTSGPTPFAGTMFYLNSDVEATEGEYIFNLHGTNTWDRITSPMQPENFVKKIGDVMSGQLSFNIKGGGNAINILAETANTGTFCGAIKWSDKSYNYSGIDTVISTIGSKGELIFSTLNAGAVAVRAKINELGVVTPSGSRYWNADNDGTGSGLDADKLDGNEGSFYQNATNLTTGTLPAARLPFTPVQQGGGTSQLTNKIYIGWLTSSQLGLQVDTTNFGVNWPINATTSTSTGKLTNAVTIALSGGVTGTATSFNGASSISIPVTSIDATKITGTLVVNTSGNAATATKLATARKIGGVDFDGTVDINLPGVNIAGNQSTSGNAATATKLATARTIGGVSFDGTANINLPGVNAAGNQSTTGNAATATLAASATKLATARTIGGVNFDGTANISLPGVNTAGNQSTTGNAATATKLATARTINGVAFDGTADITLPANDNTKLPLAGGTMTGVLTTKTSAVSTTVAALGSGGTAPIRIPTLMVGTTYGYIPAMHFGASSSSGYVGNISFGTYRPGSDWTDSGAYIAVGGADTNPTEAFLFQNGRKISNSAGAISLAGNAATATKLATARTIGGVSFDGTADISLPGVNIAGNQSTSGNAATATKLATARTIGGVSFDGTANISLPGVNAAGNQSTTGNAATATLAASATKLATARTIGGVSFDGTANISLPGVNAAGNQSTTGNAGSATKLETARTINGTSFNGTSNITTAIWGTAYTFTIGGTGKSVNGSANVSWTLAEIGALPLTGGTLTGALKITPNTASTSSTTGALVVTGGIGLGGSLYAGGNVNTYSDKRLKKDIEVITGGLEKVKKLSGYVYTRIDTGARETGVIAQEVKEVLPEVVHGDETLSVSYGNMIGLLIEAIKDLDQKVEEIRSILNTK